MFNRLQVLEKSFFLLINIINNNLQDNRGLRQRPESYLQTNYIPNKIINLNDPKLKTAREKIFGISVYLFLI